MPAGRVLWLGCAALVASGAGAIELQDDRGIAVRLATPARRIVALAPHLTEIAFAAGAGERLIGVARFSDFPAAARNLQQIGDASRVDPERILHLKPDLVLAWKSGNQSGDIARLEQLKLRVFVTEPRHVADIPELVRRVGALAGSGNDAEPAARALEAQFAALSSQYAARKPVRVFYEIWHRPLLTVSGEHMISDVIRMCGGVNVFAAMPVLTPAVSLEATIAARPEVILGGGSADTQDVFVSRWRGYEVEALRRVQVFFIAPDDIQRSTPRILAGARAICECLEKVRAGTPGATSSSRTGP